MPDIDEKRAEAIVQVKQAVQYDAAPAITDEEVSRIVDRAQAATYWLAGTSYEAGRVVMPSVLNDHRYIALIGGVSAATEPNWPKRQGDRIKDGDVIWVEDGPQLDNPFNVELGVYLGWMLKAAKAQGCTDWSTGGIKQSGDQLFQHCLKMAELAKPFGVF